MIYYYGGTFDPITKAPEAIIRKIKKEMRESDKLIIGIVQNDEKNYNVSVNYRLNMVKKSLLKQMNVCVMNELLVQLTA